MELSSVSRRRAAELKGRDAETCVAGHFQAHGYAVLGRRQRTPAGEIDLIVANRDTLVFIEVKARRSLETAAYAVPERQQRRLQQAAECLLAENAEWSRPNTRIDVALVCGYRIECIQDAIR